MQKSCTERDRRKRGGGRDTEKKAWRREIT